MSEFLGYLNADYENKSLWAVILCISSFTYVNVYFNYVYNIYIIFSPMWFTYIGVKKKKDVKNNKIYIFKKG